MKSIFYTFLFYIIVVNAVFAQADAEFVYDENINLFVDCNRCDLNYIREEITYVNYVRDREVADVHLLITQERTGSGGTQYRLKFIGQNDFSETENQLLFSVSQNDTDDEIRKILVRYIKLGLVPYIAQTNAIDKLIVGYNESESEEERPRVVQKDPWNYWVFNLGGNGSYEGEESTTSLSLNGNLSASRTTEDLKLRFSLSSRNRENNYTIDDTTYTSRSKNSNARAGIVKSLGDHWSIGGETGVYSSSYDNTKAMFYAAPAIEYNIFPYEESSYRVLRINYEIGMRKVRYEEMTIYDKLKETLFRHGLDIIYSTRQPWGGSSASLSSNQFFHDLSKFRFDIRGSLSLRVVKGLSFNISARASLIRDQLALKAGDATPEEILLRQTRLATNYDYETEIGINYTFGSIYNNIVNPRFGDRF